MGIRQTFPRTDVCVVSSVGSWNKCVCVHAFLRAHSNVVGCVKLSGIRFSVDGKTGFHVTTPNCCQSIHETGSKQKTWCDDKHE